eukprot:SAG31_NODE_5361_length_2588_cov_6.961029_3_plen_365_part_00
MTKTLAMIQAKGAIATQWRIHTPICAPSRSELQSGRYYHNIASRALTPPSCLGGGADSHGGLCLGSGAVGQVDLGAKVWPYLFPTRLRAAGYRTGLFGKCMNGDCGANTFAGGENLHTMGAFDRWFEHAGFVNGTFFDTEAPGCNISAALKAEGPELWASDRFGGGNRGPSADPESGCETRTFPGGVWSGRGDGYDTSTIGNITVEWLTKLKAEEDATPWFVYFAPHGEGCYFLVFVGFFSFSWGLIEEYGTNRESSTLQRRTRPPPRRRGTRTSAKASNHHVPRPTTIQVLTGPSARAGRRRDRLLAVVPHPSTRKHAIRARWIAKGYRPLGFRSSGGTVSISMRLRHASHILIGLTKRRLMP